MPQVGNRYVEEGAQRLGGSWQQQFTALDDFLHAAPFCDDFGRLNRSPWNQLNGL